MEVSFEAGYFGPGSPPVADRGGRTRFTWLDGEFFLIQRFAAGNPAAPSGIAIIGPGETAETFCQHYYDSRGARPHLPDEPERWRVEAAARGPGFWRRCIGVFPGGGTIKGAWEG